MAMRRNGGNIKLPDSLTRYAARMKLWESIDRPPPVDVSAYNPAGRFHPIEPLIDQNTVDDTSDSLVEIFRRAGIAEGAVDSARTAVMELLGNCFAHAETNSGLHGLACAQYWANGDMAQIAICDSGVGIRYSLTQNDALLSDLVRENACELATKYSITGKPGRGHSGYGLTLARDLMERSNGTIFVVSHEEYFYSSQGVIEAGHLGVPLQGTLVILEWNTKTPLNLAEVYRAWPLPEGMNDDDYFL
ncbi:histidine kinase-, DNA gyrase B-, and HSP90-like ATPase family protein [Burkholderia pseudomallei]|uniref:Histidine kinase-, DNA gyrase B-, and HSP90-like ATPase family protein n=2 Tax=Burkholderia pseudomallei TaxID=28450 RepID=A0AA40MAG7_BURPE|nr:histidine kinase-, DNA gyrase B-, and HSP90-like ATPase family protein [Burkholderia pseudomallei]